MRTKASTLIGVVDDARALLAHIEASQEREKTFAKQQDASIRRPLSSARAISTDSSS